MFHSVAPGVGVGETPHNISPERFWRLVDLTRRIGYQVTTEIESVARSRRETALTFDDGYEDLYSEVFPGFAERGLKAVVFVVVERLSRRNDWDDAAKSLISISQMREMHRHGFRFGSHTLSHQRLTTAPPDVLHKEVFDSKARLEDLLGDEVELFSYPWGEVDERVYAAVAEAGYRGAVTTAHRLSRTGDRLAIPRIGVSEQDSNLSFAVKLLTGRDIPYLRLTPGRLWRRALRGRPA